MSLLIAFFIGMVAGVCLSIIIAGVVLGDWFDELHGRDEDER